MSGEPVTIEFEHRVGTTRVHVGQDALAASATALGADLAGRTVFVITSRRVADLHASRLEPLATEAERWVPLEVADGESAKSLSVAEGLWSRMLSEGGKRDSVLIAFGGGTVGDLAGFVAAAFLRGIDFYQIPTTLLAQVDAALGGKVAVNLPEAKNSVGFFHHPLQVVCDTGVLATLPAAELRSGLMEVIKIAAIDDAELFGRVEEGLGPLLRGEAGALTPIVAAAAGAKIEIVRRDPLENGERRLLNFGHTLAHALEGAQGYRGLRHGEAVGYGMLFALRLARARGLGAAAAERIRALIARCDLPPLKMPPPATLLSLMRRDKKARESGLHWVIPTALGEGTTTPLVGEREILAALEAFAADPLARIG